LAVSSLRRGRSGVLRSSAGDSKTKVSWRLAGTWLNLSLMCIHQLLKDSQEIIMSKSTSRCLVSCALTLTGALSGCVSFQKCGFEGCPGDAQISAKIQAQLAQDTAMEPNAISVQTLDHEVYLYGLVSSSLEIDDAVAVASNVPGVTHVVSSVAVTN
jgi:BON domain